MRKVLVILLFISTLLFLSGCEEEISLSYTVESFQKEELEVVTIDNSNVFLHSDAIDNITQTFYNDEDYIYSYITIEDTDYFLGKTLYSPGDIESKEIPLKLIKTDLNKNSTIYKFFAIIGSNYAKTSYIIVENEIPKIILSIDGNTFEKDVDNDSVKETISEYGSPGPQTTIYKLDFNNEKVSYVYLNKTVFNDSPSVYINEKSQIIAYVDGKENYYTLKDDKLYSIKNK